MSDVPITTAAAAPATSAPTAVAERRASRGQVLLISLVLSLVTGLLFARSLTCDFVVWDDDLYVFQNDHVRRGFQPDSWEWLSTAVVLGNWHPLTMITHLLDVELYGLEPWGHHLTNVLLHALSTGLLCYVLWRMSGALWPSVVAAALFGLHPLRVESVTWVAERKDVLSVFFFVLALWAYTNFVQRGRWIDYGLLLLAATLGLMSKSMLVTLPFVLLLLDYWPLGRLGSLAEGSSAGGKSGRSRAARAKRSSQQKTFAQLLLEKLPLFALVAIISAVTFYAQKSQGALRSALPMSIRVLNALLAYRDYLLQTIWPSSLCVFYPHPGLELNKVAALIAGLALALFTAFFIQQRAKMPFLIVGWLWFLGTLVPTIGLIQVGGAAHSDRYTYLPSIGLAIMVAWLVYELAMSRRLLPQASVAMLVIVVALGIVTWRQQAYWKNTIALCHRAIDSTKENFIANELLGRVYLADGHPREAIQYLQTSLKIMPIHRLAAVEIAMALRELQETQKSLDVFDHARRIGANDAETAVWHAEALSKLGRRDVAHQELLEALRFDPSNEVGNALLAQILAADGSAPAALNGLREAHRAYPTKPQIAARLAWLLSTYPDPSMRNATEALKVIAETKPRLFKPDFALLQAEAAALAEKGNFDAAIAVAKEAEDLLAARIGTSPRRQKQLDELREQMRVYQSGQPWRENPSDPARPPQATQLQWPREAQPACPVAYRTATRREVGPA